MSRCSNLIEKFNKISEAKNQIKNNGYTYNLIKLKDALKKPNSKDLGTEASKYNEKDISVYWIDDESKLDNVKNKSNFLWVIIKKDKSESVDEASLLDDKYDIGDSIVKHKFKGFSIEKLGKAEYLDDSTTLVIMYSRLVDSNGFYVNDGKAETATGEGFIISTLPTEDDIYKAHRWVKGTYKPIMIKDNGTANLLRETTKEAKRLAKKL